MKKTLVYLLASLVVLMFSVPASAGIEWSGNIMTGIEKMDYGVDKVETTYEIEVWVKDGPNSGHWKKGTITETKYAEDELQFSNTKLNLDVKGDVCEGVVGVAELRAKLGNEYGPLYVADEAEEVKLANDNVWARQVYVEISDILIPDTSLRIGRIELPLGAELETTSENADTMKNPLIFGSVLAEHLESQWLDHGLMIAKTIGVVNAKLAISNGTDQQKDTNSDKAYTLNLSGGCPGVPGLSIAGTYYTSDNADEPKETDEVKKWIFDVGYHTGLLKLAAAIGNVEGKWNEDSNVKTEDIDYLVLEVVYGNGETPWWVAVRHSTAKPTTKPGTDPKDDVDDVKRLELGAGYKLCDNAYLKVEYIDHEVKDEVKFLDDYDGIKAIVNIAF